MAKLKLGVDVGGTFTDVVGINEDGKVYFAKTPSTPEDQSIGVLNGIRALLEELGVAPDCVTGVAHGTTVATNTLLERNGAVTALITTKGFRDVLDIGRQSRPELYDLHARKPASLIPRYLRREADERMDYTGTVLVQLDMEELKKTIHELRERNPLQSVFFILMRMMKMRKKRWKLFVKSHQIFQCLYLVKFCRSFVNLNE